MPEKSYRSKPSRFCMTLICTTLLLSGCEHLSQSSTTLSDEAIKAELEAKVTEKATEKDTIANKKKLLTTEPAQALTPQTAWEEILAAPGLNTKLNRRIQQQKEWYLQHPAFLSKVLTRAEPFLAYVIHEADKRKLPRALALLPIVESRYDPHAISKSGAVGTWQFMPATAQHFGIKMNWWFDGRRDIITSTDAALTYLSQLHNRFDGDWFLALASYNAGGGTVNKAITRNKYLGKSTDYWSLGLPEETKNYVPRLLALVSIIEDAEKNGVVLPLIPTKPAVTAIHTGGQVDIAQIASFAGISEVQFRALNPGFRRWASDPQGPHMVLVPSDNAKTFQIAVGSLPKDRQISWRKHKVQPGDTISQIAKTYNMPTQEFKRMNQLSTSFIKVGQSLIVPNASTLMTGTGQIITAENIGTKAKQLTSIDHRIQQGDTLWDISRQYNTSIRTIAAENNIPTRAPLKVGKILTIQIIDGTSSQKVNYKVRAGDSLYGIARKFKVSIGEIATWNALDKKNHIKPGQKLTLYLSDES